MTERGILFSAAMVRALLDGSKTQTRRSIKPQPDVARAGVIGPIDGGFVGRFTPEDEALGRLAKLVRCPYGAGGDRLWVRETWAQNENQTSDTHIDRSIVYRADGGQRALDNGGEKPWRPAIHMFRWASRITLEITEIRVERLQDISRGDAMEEGCPFANMAKGPDPRRWYAELWESINGAESWHVYPTWVWVVSFRRVEA